MDMHQEAENVEERLPEAYDMTEQFPEQQTSNENDKVPIELTNTTGTYLLQINDDCLMEIFSVKSLSPMDLCCLAETCRRFQQICQRIFPKHLRIAIWSNENYKISTARKYLPSKYAQSPDVEGIFKNFGLLLEKVCVSEYGEDESDWISSPSEDESVCSLFEVSDFGEESSNLSSFVLNLVADYCVDRLKIPDIFNAEITAQLTVKLKPIFKQLQVLHLWDCKVTEDNRTLFADLDSLIELSFDECLSQEKTCSLVLENDFPKLERIYCGRSYPNEHLLSTFLSRHTKLKTLHLTAYLHNDELRMNISHAIVNSCKELKELRLAIGKIDGSSIHELQALQSLKILKLKSVNCEDLKYFAALTELRELYLNDCDLPKDSNQFTQLTQLTELHIHCYELDAIIDVVAIVRRLMNLEVLAVDKSLRYGGGNEFVLDEKTFSKIVEVVKGRPNVLTLKCKFNFVFSCDENRKVKVLSYHRV